MKLSSLLFFVTLFACAPVPYEEGRLELLSFRQGGQDGVRLNEPLDFHFSVELDRASITTESFRIHDGDGGLVRGRITVQGKKLVFHPHLPLQTDLLDGSFVPAREYTIELLGFPRPDGVRGLRGEILARSHRVSFRTVDWGEDVRYFLDPAPERLQIPLDVEPGGRRIGPLEPFRFRTPAPLDPGTLRADDFRLFRFRDASLEPIPIRVELVQNDARGARIELRPAGESADIVPAFEPGEYYLPPPESALTLRALGGQPVLRSRYLIEVSVVGPRIEQHREEFEAIRGRSRDPVPGADGTALWGHGSSVRLRFPLAAGDGHDGELELVGEASGKDLHATRIWVRPGARLDLPDSGLVVLRSQTSLVIDGYLRRRVEPGKFAWREGEFFTEWRRRTGGARGSVWDVPSLGAYFGEGEGSPIPRSEWTSVSDFLGVARDENHGWTILIAGGDIVVRGTIELDGPLLLVAGGVIRIEGHIRARETWRPAGGPEHPIQHYAHAPLRIDEPTGANPLVTHLRQAVLSEPIRPARGVQRWRSGRFEANPGSGSARVRFQGERSQAGGGTLVFGPVEDIALLEGCQAVRLLIELEMGPGESWARPSVSWCEISWDESP